MALALRLEGLDDALWMDEGVSVGISSHSLLRIPGLLVQDGSPPLYYLLLRGWMAIVGRSEAQTHALSLLLALAAVPLALWAGWSLFSPRVGWILAGLVATSPFLGFFAVETRMYTLAVVLALVATAAHLHVFAFGRSRYLPLFVAALVLLLYTHNWGLFLALAAAVAVVPCALATSHPLVVLRRAALGFGAVALLYLPWVPTLLAQARRTGAPWSPTPGVRDAVSALAVVLGDESERVLVALVLTAGLALVAVVRRPREPEGAAAIALAILVGVTLAAGWAAARVEPAWSPRYLAVLLPALLLLAALGLARSGGAGVVALAIVLVVWIQPVARLAGDEEPLRTNAAADREISELVRPYLRTGDLVVAAQMEEVPVLRYYLGPGLRFADPTGLVADPWVVDWRDAEARMAAARPAPLLAAVDALPAGGHIFLVCPSDPDASDLPWFRTMNQRCADLRAAFVEAPALRRVAVPGVTPYEEGGDRFLGLFEKVGP
ncbi:MAG TPA: glycosyltransferase family 39 protein [Acidimicrobiales bacterium]|nr:glycosyltransferase family 39 protein [Acidimicrobiales bacterium]